MFHPTTVRLADDSRRFMCFLIEICVEHINEGYHRTLTPGVPGNSMVLGDKRVRDGIPMSPSPTFCSEFSAVRIPPFFLLARIFHNHRRFSDAMVTAAT